MGKHYPYSDEDRKLEIEVGNWLACDMSGKAYRAIPEISDEHLRSRMMRQIESHNEWRNKKRKD